MKRSVSLAPRVAPNRDSPYVKRNRYSMCRYDDTTPQPQHTPTVISRDPRVRLIATERGHTFKVLCISTIHPKASDDYVKDSLYRAFKRFGDFSIRIGRDHDELVAYVSFRSCDAACEAKRLKPCIIFYEKSAMITAVYERPEHKYEPRSMSPEYDGCYQPQMTERQRAPTVDPYALFPLAHHEYRPSMNHHEHMPPGGPKMRYGARHMPPRAPMMHHGPPHMHPSHHHYVPRHTFRYPPPLHASKKDKFSNNLHNAQPEDDPQATRTLYVGNLEVNISEEDLRRNFGKYGQLDDINIKRPSQGAGNTFAFVRFENLEMSYRAKIELFGQYIGKFPCKIGYGRANPTTRIWVGGLGAWTSLTQLEREFDRFGSIKKIEYNKGDTCAYISYESIEVAQVAVKEMRGYALGGPDRRLRIDFAGVPNNTSISQTPRSPSPPETDSVYCNVSQQERRPLLALECEPANNRTDEPVTNNNRTQKSILRSPGPHTPDSEPDENISPSELLGSAATLSDVARKAVIQWSGALILKSSLFPSKLYLTDGDKDIVSILMKDEKGSHNLRITKRLRMDQTKLNVVQERIRTSKSHAIFLALSGSGSFNTNDASIQKQPFKNLESYLKHKDAAGVLPLLQKTILSSGVLYAFPPCQFSADLLRRTCHNLTDETLKQDYLVVVVVRGAQVAQL